jgi:hypothetical protein
MLGAIDQRNVERRPERLFLARQARSGRWLASVCRYGKQTRHCLKLAQFGWPGGHVGSDNEKADWHEFGRGHYPARPVLGGALHECEGEIMEIVFKGIKAVMEGP